MLSRQESDKTLNTQREFGGALYFRGLDKTNLHSHVIKLQGATNTLFHISHAQSHTCTHLCTLKISKSEQVSCTQANISIHAYR